MERSYPTFIQFGTFAIASDESMTESRDPELYCLVDDAYTAVGDISPRAEITLPLKHAVR